MLLSFFFLFTFYRLLAVLSGWKSPPESSILGLCETRARSTWDTCIQFRRCLPSVYRFSHSLLGLSAQSWPTRHSCVSGKYQQLMYIIYNVRVQRPSAVSRVYWARAACQFSLATGIIISQRTNTNRQLAYYATRGRYAACLCPQFIVWIWWCIQMLVVKNLFQGRKQGFQRSCKGNWNIMCDWQRHGCINLYTIIKIINSNTMFICVFVSFSWKKYSVELQEISQLKIWSLKPKAWIEVK